MDTQTSGRAGAGLRPYQIAAREAVRSKFRAGERAALVVLPTGTGKTRTALTMAADTIRRGRRVLWLAHRMELVDQPVRAWRALPALDGAGSAGVVMAGRDDADADLVCASVQTLARGDRLARILAYGMPALVVVDEAHHSTAGQWRAVLEQLDGAAAAQGVRRPWWVGLTATPERTDRAALSCVWGDQAAYVYTYHEAIADGYLCPPQYVVDRLVLDSATAALLERASAEDDEAEMARLLLRAGVVEHTVAAMQRATVGRRSLVFTADVEQAMRTRQALLDVGIRAAAVSGETPRGQRRMILRAFIRHEIDVICNCAVLTEGTDLPCCDAIVAARPFSSKPLWVQAVGRGLRLHPGKDDCLVLDLVGASEEHTIIIAAAMLDTEADVQERRPFVGLLRRPIGTGHSELRPPARVVVEPIVSPQAQQDDPDAWRVVGLVVGEQTVQVEPVRVVVPRDVAREKEEEEDGEGESQVANYWRERRRVIADWVPCDDHDRAWVCDVGSFGLILLIDLGEEEWMTFLVPPRSRKPRPMGRRPTDQETARSLGDDIFRQSGQLVSTNAAWKRGPPSEKAIAFAKKLDVYREGMTAGDVTRVIAKSKGRRCVRAIGVNGFRAALRSW